MKNAIALFVFLFFFLSKTFAQHDTIQNTASFLPLQISSFQAAVVSKSVRLQWTLGSNEEARSFDIERSDEAGAYKKVGSKLAASQAGSVAYEFVDALPKKGIVLTYRIKLLSKDGAGIFSDSQSLSVEEGGLQCRLKQNPVRQAIDVEVTAADAALLRASVYTAYGQKIKTETAKLSAGANQLSFSSQALLPGLHRLVLESGSERAVISFVKE